MRFLALFLVVLISCEQKKPRVIATINLKNWEDQMEVIRPLDSIEISRVVKSYLKRTWEPDVREIEAAFPKAYVDNLNLDLKRREFIYKYLREHDFNWASTVVDEEKRNFIITKKTIDSSSMELGSPIDVNIYFPNYKLKKLEPLFLGKYFYFSFIGAFEEMGEIKFINDGTIVTHEISTSCGCIPADAENYCLSEEVIVNFNLENGNLVETSRDTIR